MKVVLFGDGDWAIGSLHALREAGHEIRAVVLRARPTASDLEHAARHLGCAILQPSRVNAPDCVEAIRALEADVHLSVAYNQIFGDAIRSLVPWFLNVHAGKLPRYRGRNVVNWALINGEEEIGITVHLVDAGIDTGDIVLQRTLPIGWTDTYGSVLERVVAAVPGLVVESLGLIARGLAAPTPQPPGGFYCGGRQEGDEWLEWDQSSRRLYNKVRAITRPGPGALTSIGDVPVVIWHASYEPRWPEYLGTPGEVVGHVAGCGVQVKTADSLLVLHEIQLPGQPPQAPAWPLGTRLGRGRPAGTSDASPYARHSAHDLSSRS